MNETSDSFEAVSLQIHFLTLIRQENPMLQFSCLYSAEKSGGRVFTRFEVCVKPGTRESILGLLVVVDNCSKECLFSSSAGPKMSAVLLL